MSTSPVVEELIDLRTATSCTYLLADGTKRAELFETPINYLDQEGHWQTIDTSLFSLNAPTDSLLSPMLSLYPDPVYFSIATPMGVTIASETDTQEPVKLTYDGSVVTFDMVRATETDLTVSGSEAVFSGVTTATDVSYEVLADGVKEQITLASADAPATFRYFVSHDGMDLRQDETGQWGFYRPNEKSPIFELGEILTVDSANPVSGDPAVCDGAEMTVTPAEGGSYISYTVPQEWLSDPARVYPVQIDPTVTLGQSVCTDTYISSAYPSTAYGNSTELRAGYTSSTGYEYGLIKFDLSSLSNPDVPYVVSAHLRLKQFAVTGSSSHPMNIDWANMSWSGSSTYNSLASGFGYGAIGTQVPDPNDDDWLDQPAAWVTQAWLNDYSSQYGMAFPNNGFVLRDTASTQRKFRASEYSTSTERPRLVVEYETPSATVSNTARAYRIGDMVRVTVAVGGTDNLDKIEEIRLGINRAGANSSDYRGVMDWCKTDGRFYPDTWDDWRFSPYAVDGGVFGSYETDTDATGNLYITPALKNCTYNAQTGVADFYFRINDNFDYSTDNRFAVLVKMGTASDQEAWSSGWKEVGSNFAVQAPLTATVSGSDWFTETDTNGDGQPDNADDTEDQGRGSVTLDWPNITRADGYQIQLWDGSQYRNVGKVFGKTNSSWSSDDLGIYPKDSQINAGLPSSAAGNPYFHVTAPDDPSQSAAQQPSGYTQSAGLLAGDGTYLYARARSGQDGSNYWKKIDTSNWSVSQIGPNLSSKPALSAFCYANYVYSGFADKSGTDNNPVAKLRGVQTTSGATTDLTLDKWPLNRDTGAEITGDSSNLLFASDGTFLYNVTDTFTTTGGVPNYDGFKIRIYSINGTTSASFTSNGGSIAMDSFKLSHVLVDDNFIYLCEWSDTNSARVLKIRKSEPFGQSSIVNQWTEHQADTKVCAGFYDITNHVFWLGHLTGRLANGTTETTKFYKYDTGFDLRDDPNAIYNLSSAGQSADWTHYSFRVVPFVGDSVGSDAADYTGTIVTLDNRTVHLNEVPRHATAALPGFDGHSAAVIFDKQALALSTTDMALTSFGPSATLDRTYISARDPIAPGVTLESWQPGRFASGWRFGFERSLYLTDVAGHIVRYVDEAGNSYKFIQIGSSNDWDGPYGQQSSLSGSSGSTWALTFKDGTRLDFDSAGHLAKETDSNGNYVEFIWTGSTRLYIKAASKVYIDVRFAGSGRISYATYSARKVTYGSSADTVDFGPTMGGAYRRVSYGYSGSELTSITARAAPVASSDPCAEEQFSYSSGALVGVTMPEALTSPVVSADAHLEIAGYSAASGTTLGHATITTHGVRDAGGNDLIRPTPADVDYETTYSWNSSNTMATVPKARVAGASEPTAARLRYSPDNQVAGVKTALGLVSATAIDKHGNVIATQDPLGHGAVSIYQDYTAPANAAAVDLPLASINAAGATSFFTYKDDARNLIDVVVEVAPAAIQSVDVSRPPASPPNQSAEVKTETQYDYEDVAVSYATVNQALVSKAVYVGPSTPTAVGNRPAGGYPNYSADEWRTTEYTYSDRSGQPATITSGSSQIEAIEYDSYGQVTERYKGTSATLYSDDSRVESSAWDSNGRLASTTGPCAKVSSALDAAVFTTTKHLSYDTFGNVVESWTTSDDPDASNYIDPETCQIPKRMGEVVRTVSPSGWVTKESYRDGFSAEDPQPELYSVSYSYDGLGQRTLADDSRIAGEPARTDYDDQGKVSASWTEGCVSYDFHSASRQEFDLDGRVTKTWSPGGDLTNADRSAETATVSFDYNADGSQRKVMRRDGTWTHFGYDSAERVADSTSPTEDYNADSKVFAVATQLSEYDLQSNVIRSIDPAGVKTVYAYDRAGEKVYETLLTPEPLNGDLKPAEGEASTSLDDSATWTLYDSLGRVIKEDSTEAVDTETTYDDYGNVKESKIGDVRTVATYNGAHQVLTTQTGDLTQGTATVEFERGSLTVYDHWGQTKEQVTGPGGLADTNAVSTTRRDTSTYAYDAQGRITDKTLTRTKDTVVTTLLAQHSEFLDPSASGNTDHRSVLTTSVYGFDATQTPTTTTDLITQDLAIDGAGRDTAATTTLTGGSASSYERTFSYDVADRQTGTQSIRVGGTEIADDATYSANGYLRTITYRAATWTSEIMAAEYTYSSKSGRLTDEANTFISVSELNGDFTNAYKYSPNGRLSKVDDTEYTFNGGGALTKVDTGSSSPTEFTYTARQKVKTKTAGATATRYIWDTDNDRRVSQGPTEANQDIFFTYTGANELRRVRDLTNSNDEKNTWFTYDGNAQRTKTVVETGSGSTTTEYLYDGLKLLSVKSYAGTDASVQPDWSITYLYDSSESPYAGYYTTSDDDRVWFTVVTNLRGDVVELLDKYGRRFASYRYSVWGGAQGSSSRATVNNGSTTISADIASDIMGRQHLRYAGYYYDTSTELYYCSARYYDPDTRQFISRDPIKADGQESAYQYVNGNPVLTVDPSGLVSGQGGRTVQRNGRDPKQNAIAVTEAKDKAKIDGATQDAKDLGLIAERLVQNLQGQYLTDVYRSGICSRPSEEISDIDVLFVMATIAEFEVPGGEVASPGTTAAYLSYRAGMLVDRAYETARDFALLTRGADALGAGVSGFRTGSTLELLTDAARAADGAVKFSGNPSVRGTLVHSQLSAIVKALGGDLNSEVSYLEHEVAGYSLKGTIRLDVVEGPLDAPRAVYDLKTGKAGLSSARIAQIRAQLPYGYQDIPIYTIWP